MSRRVLLHLSGIQPPRERWLYVRCNRRTGFLQHRRRRVGEVNYFSDRRISDAAQALIRFDVDSIRQVVAAQRSREPEVWLADPDSYEKDGRVLRDSPSSRLLAYSRLDNVIYATDGCNACTRRLAIPLESISDSELQSFAEDNDFRLDLLERLAELTRRTRDG